MECTHTRQPRLQLPWEEQLVATKLLSDRLATRFNCTRTRNQSSHFRLRKITWSVSNVSLTDEPHNTLVLALTAAPHSHGVRETFQTHLPRRRRAEEEDAPERRETGSWKHSELHSWTGGGE